MPHEQQNKEIVPEEAWQLILAVRQRVRSDGFPFDGLGLRSDPSGSPGFVAATEADALLAVNRDGGWRCFVELSQEVGQLFDLYLPVALGSESRPLTLAHLGQSLDGRIATEGGDSYYVTGAANILHLHRLRALSDAVIVGAGTVKHDDPQLTTRRAPGENPVRVVIDTERRLEARYKVFTDGAAPTLLVSRAGAGTTPLPAPVRSLEIEAEDMQIPPAAIVAALRAEGLHSLFVEGGGVTVSRFLAAGVLDRLQVAVAPLIIGSGRPAFTLPPVGRLAEARRPPCRRFEMGEDVLFDFDLRGEVPSPSSG
ncbi:MAG: RibD family protein [Kiloniellales bacterium]|nr:RibD family protein [Kiloniellales bacterium]